MVAMVALGVRAALSSSPSLHFLSLSFGLVTSPLRSLEVLDWLGRTETREPQTALAGSKGGRQGLAH